MKRITKAIRKRIEGNMYEYGYWACPACNCHSTGSNGLPEERCRNCNICLYTDIPNPGTTEILIIKTIRGFEFRILRVF